MMIFTTEGDTASITSIMEFCTTQAALCVGNWYVLSWSGEFFVVLSYKERSWFFVEFCDKKREKKLILTASTLTTILNIMSVF